MRRILSRCLPTPNWPLLHRRPRKAKKEKKENVTVAEEDLELIRMITGKFEHGELEESEKFGGESQYYRG